MGKQFMITAVLMVIKFEASFVLISSHIYTGLQGPVLLLNALDSDSYRLVGKTDLFPFSYNSTNINYNKENEGSKYVKILIWKVRILKSEIYFRPLLLFYGRF